MTRLITQFLSRIGASLTEVRRRIFGQPLREQRPNRRHDGHVAIDRIVSTASGALDENASTHQQLDRRSLGIQPSRVGALRIEAVQDRLTLRWQSNKTIDLLAAREICVFSTPLASHLGIAPTPPTHDKPAGDRYRDARVDPLDVVPGNVDHLVSSIEFFGPDRQPDENLSRFLHGELIAADLQLPPENALLLHDRNCLTLYPSPDAIHVGRICELGSLSVAFEYGDGCSLIVHFKRDALQRLLSLLNEVEREPSLGVRWK